MPECILQRCVFPTEPGLQPLYYRTAPGRGDGAAGASPRGRWAAALPPGATLRTDTYLNTFFESYWRRFTSLDWLALRLELTGEGEVRLLRRAGDGPAQVLRTGRFAGSDVDLTLEVPAPDAGSPASALHFEITAGAAAVLLCRADWRALGAEPRPVQLAVGFCTFNREALLLANLQALLDDHDLAGRVGRVIVVDQGTEQVRRHRAFPPLSARAGDRLDLIEQANFGGAGGFTRAILEARRGRATHMLLMDDDSTIEPESIFRLGAFFALARGEFAVGGPMLDGRSPWEVAEAGTLLHPERLGNSTPLGRRGVETADALPVFFPVGRTHYNPWWFFGFPLKVIDRVGLPLPVFIRGDDAEFGCRLRRRGIRTVTVPGLAVWHEPFYLKKGGWHPYYDFRNMLILTAVHFPQSSLLVAVVFLRKLVHALLCLNYFQAWLVCKALDDFCTGPRVLEDPHGIHRRLLARQRALGPRTLTRTASTPAIQPAPAPSSRLGMLGRLLACAWRQWAGPDPAPGAPVTKVIPWEDAGWWSLGVAEAVGVTDPSSERILVYYRSRRRFIGFLIRGMKLLRRLFARHGRVRKAWRDAFPRLTRSAFWDEYLGPGGQSARPLLHERRAG